MGVYQYTLIGVRIGTFPFQWEAYHQKLRGLFLIALITFNHSTRAVAVLGACTVSQELLNTLCAYRLSKGMASYLLWFHGSFFPPIEQQQASRIRCFKLNMI